MCGGGGGQVNQGKGSICNDCERSGIVGTDVCYQKVP